MTREELYQIECNIESVLKKHASALPVRDWHVAAAPEDGVICATVSHDVFRAETKGLTKAHWAEVERILEEHLPAKFSGRWHVNIRVALDYSPVVWLKPVDARNPRQHP